jgi:hypothetical protein
MMLVPNINNPSDPSYYHVIEDEFGNPTPTGIQSCWLKSAEGVLTLAEYAAERYSHA